MRLLLVLLPKNNSYCVSGGTVGLKISILSTTSKKVLRSTFVMTEDTARRICSGNRSSATFGIVSSRHSNDIRTRNNTSVTTTAHNCISNSCVSFGPHSLIQMQGSWRNRNDQQQTVSFSTTSKNQRQRRQRIDQNLDKEIKDDYNVKNDDSKNLKDRYFSEAQQEVWQQHYEQLRSVVENYYRSEDSLQNERQEPSLYRKHQSVPLPDNLMAWLYRQRHMLRQYRKRRLKQNTTKLSDTAMKILEDRIRKLREIGYSIFPRDYFWDKKYSELCDFLVKYDGKFPYDADVVDKLDDREKKLLHWCERQKRMYRNCQRISSRRENDDGHENDRSTQSISMNNDDNCDNDDIDRHHQDHEKDDDSDTDDDNDTMHTNLSSSEAYERIQKLEQLGFVFNSNDTRWNMMFECLVDYYKEHGNCLVPRDYLPDKQLGTWVQGQRYDYKLFQRNDSRSAISIERINKLNSVNFEWNALDAQWLMKYNELRKFVLFHSPGVFPSYKKYSSLLRWLKYQQTLKDKTCYTAENIEATPTSRKEPAIESHGLTVDKKIDLLQKLGYLLD